MAKDEDFMVQLAELLIKQSESTPVVIHMPPLGHGKHLWAVTLRPSSKVVFSARCQKCGLVQDVQMSEVLELMAQKIEPWDFGARLAEQHQNNLCPGTGTQN